MPPAAAEAVQALEQPPEPEDTKDGLLQDALEKMMCREFSRLAVRGYLHQGFTFNPDAPHDRQNFGRLFDDRSNDYRLNQLMLTLEQTVDAKKCLDWGFKAQFGVGTDARFTHATGTLEDVTDEPIEPEINELNATLHFKAGIAGDLKVGMYPSLCGLESIDPTANFLYSHSYIFNFGVPFKHTGFMLFAQVADNLQLMAGIDRGINVGLDDNNDAVSFNAAVIGKLFCEKLSYTLAAHYGPEDPEQLGTLAGFDADDENRLIVDLATTWNVNDKWTADGRLQLRPRGGAGRDRRLVARVVRSGRLRRLQGVPTRWISSFAARSSATPTASRSPSSRRTTISSTSRTGSSTISIPAPSAAGRRPTTPSRSG